VLRKDAMAFRAGFDPAGPSWYVKAFPEGSIRDLFRRNSASLSCEREFSAMPSET
jgi:hypothetical protein